MDEYFFPTRLAAAQFFVANGFVRFHSDREEAFTKSTTSIDGRQVVQIAVLVESLGETLRYTVTEIERKPVT